MNVHQGVSETVVISGGRRGRWAIVQGVLALAGSHPHPHALRDHVA